MMGYRFTCLPRHTVDPKSRVIWIVLCGIDWISPASAELCEAPDIQTDWSYLKRLSLDLRGHLSSHAEYVQVVDTGAVSDDPLEDMFFSDGFSHQMRQDHRDVLGSNIRNQRFAPNTFMLSAGRRGREVYSSRATPRRMAYRGANIDCLAQPVVFHSDGRIMTDDVGRRYMLTGQIPAGLQAQGSSIPTRIVAQQGDGPPIPNVISRAKTYTKGLTNFASGLSVDSAGDLALI